MPHVMTDSSGSHDYKFPLYSIRLSCCIEIYASIPYNNYQVSSRQAVWLRMVWRDWKGRAQYWLGGFCAEQSYHSLVLTSLFPLTDITLTDSWYHHHHHQHHHHHKWLFPALSLGLVRYVILNRIIPRITGGMLLQGLSSRSSELLPVPSPVLPRTIFCFGQKTWHRIHCAMS